MQYIVTPRSLVELHHHYRDTSTSITYANKKQLLFVSVCCIGRIALGKALLEVFRSELEKPGKEPSFT